MPFTSLADKPVMTAQKVAVALVPAVADFMKPKVTELNAGVRIECVLQSIDLSGADMTTTEYRTLCELQPEVIPVRVNHTWPSPLDFTLGDPQQENARIALCPQFASIYAYVRPGPFHTDPFAAAQKLVGFRLMVGAVTLGPIDNTDGNFFQGRLLASTLEGSGLWAEVAA